MRRRKSKEEFEPSSTLLLLRGRIPMVALIQTLAVAEHLNFRHAANALGVAQSSVSTRVKTLEEDLGILLFERHARGVRLTEAGRHFVEKVDVAFVLGTPDIPDCHSRLTWAEQLMIALPATHPLADGEGVTWADLSAETFLVRHNGTGPQLHDLILLRLAERWPRPFIQRFNVDRLTLISMVEQGYGVTLATESTSQIRFPGVVFMPVLDEPGPVAFSAVWSPNNRAPALRDFLELAKKASR